MLHRQGETDEPPCSKVELYTGLCVKQLTRDDGLLELSDGSIRSIIFLDYHTRLSININIQYCLP